VSDWRDGAPPEEKHRLTDCCARCFEPLTPERRSEHFTGCRYCLTCLPITNTERAYPPLPKPDAATLLAWDQEYKNAMHPMFSAILSSAFPTPKKR